MSCVTREYPECRGDFLRVVFEDCLDLLEDACLDGCEVRLDLGVARSFDRRVFWFLDVEADEASVSQPHCDEVSGPAQLEGGEVRVQLIFDLEHAEVVGLELGLADRGADFGQEPLLLLACVSERLVIRGYLQTDVEDEQLEDFSEAPAESQAAVS